MNDDDDVPVYPLLAYGTGLNEDAVVISLEMATNPDQYERREGRWVSTAMTPDQAMEFGRDLIETAERAKAGGTVN